MKQDSLIKRLVGVALTLPGLCQEAQAGRSEETYNADFQYAHYSESGQRMSADVFEGELALPIGRQMSASVHLVRDSLSGASPMFYMKDSNNRPKMILSGASIREQRDAITASFSYFWDRVAAHFNGGYSREHDYVSRYFGLNSNWDFNHKLTTLNLGASVAFDEIQPTGADYKRSKTSQQYLLGVSQILDRDSLLNMNMTFAYHTGFLSDPYKLVYFDGGGVFADTRPEHKFQWAWLVQYVRHFEAANQAALHADYRFYLDDWGVHAHTVELSWDQPIADGWRVVPRFRYYSQDKADFYQPYFTGTPTAAVYSSDYRLAGFGAISGGIKIIKDFVNPGGWFPLLRIQAGVEYYDRRSSYQLGGSKQGAFDNFNYYLVNASFNLRF